MSFEDHQAQKPSSLSLIDEELRDAKRFDALMPKMLKAAGLAWDRRLELWTIRQFVLTSPAVGYPIALFNHILGNSGSLRRTIARLDDETERAARQEMRAVEKPVYPAKSDPDELPMFSMEEPPKPAKPDRFITFREFAIGELGPEAATMPHRELMSRLYEKSARESWWKVIGPHVKPTGKAPLPRESRDLTVWERKQRLRQRVKELESSNGGETGGEPLAW